MAAILFSEEMSWALVAWWRTTSGVKYLDIIITSTSDKYLKEWLYEFDLMISFMKHKRKYMIWNILYCPKENW